MEICDCARLHTWSMAVVRDVLPNNQFGPIYFAYFLQNCFSHTEHKTNEKEWIWSLTVPVLNIHRKQRGNENSDEKQHLDWISFLKPSLQMKRTKPKYCALKEILQTLWNSLVFRAHYKVFCNFRKSIFDHISILMVEIQQCILIWALCDKTNGFTHRCTPKWKKP